MSLLSWEIAVTAGQHSARGGNIRAEVKTWLLFGAVVVALLIQRRLRPDPLVECDRASQRL